MHRQHWSVIFLSITWFCLAEYLPAQDIVTGLVHHWKLDESGLDEAAIDSVGGNLISLGGYQTSDPRWAPGIFGNALRFSRPSNYALTSAPINMNQYTVALWLNRFDNSGINPRIATPQGGAWITIRDEINEGLGIGAVRSLIPPVLGEWEHYALTFDVLTDEVNVYKNGSLVRTGTESFLEPDNDLWIFAHNQDTANSNGSFNGLFDDLRFYNRLLEPGDVSALFHGELGDMDFDGDVDFDDISAFVMGLQSEATYEATYGVPATLHGDIDGSGRHDFDDIPGFVALLTGGVNAVPEPTTLLLACIGLAVFIPWRRAVRCF